MNTAQRILAANNQKTFGQQQALESEARNMAIKTDAANCYDRTWTFYDGSKITKARDGFTA
jgi:hypothetical protein